MRHRYSAESSLARFRPGPRTNELIHDVVDIRQRQDRCFIADRDRQVMRDVVAKCRHDAVVIGPAPLAEQIREALNARARAGLRAVGTHQLLRRTLGYTVRIILHGLHR